MSEFDKFLAGIPDHELAIFFRYRYQGFLSKSKEKIDIEINNRKLSPEQLESYSNKKLIIEKSNEIKTCPRCGSDKLSACLIVFYSVHRNKILCSEIF